MCCEDEPAQQSAQVKVKCAGAFADKLSASALARLTNPATPRERREDEKNPLLPLLLDLLICSWNSRSFFLLLCFCSILCCWHSISATLLSQTKSRVAGTASLTLLKCCEACTRLASLPPSLTSPARRHPLTSLLEVAQAIFKVRGSVFKNLVGKRSLRKGRKGRDSLRRRAMPEAVRLGNAQGRFAATARSAGARASARTSASGALARSAGARGCATRECRVLDMRKTNIMAR